jgi:hypothetical protein
MADDVTGRWELPLLVPGQAQKEMTHNEALAALDLITQAVVEAVGGNAPPAGPAEGRCWIVGDAPTDAWEGHAREIAGWTAGGWRFVAPRAGMAAWIVDRGVSARFGDAGWTIGEIAGESLILGGEALLGAPAAAIADPAGGGTPDSEARAAILSILTVLRHHRLILTA